MMRILTNYKLLSSAAASFVLVCLVTSPQAMQAEQAVGFHAAAGTAGYFHPNLAIRLATFRHAGKSRHPVGGWKFLDSGFCRHDDRSLATTRIAEFEPREPVQLSLSGEETPQELPGNLAETGSKVLAEVIVYLRDIALESSKPMPEEIKRKLTPYFDRQILEKVRYTTDWSPMVGAALRRFIDTDNYALAVALDNVVVFSDEESLDNLWLWAHELKHVEQYDRWGVKTFAFNYLQNYQTVENEANEYAGQVLRQLHNLPKKPTTPGSHF